MWQLIFLVLEILGFINDLANNKIQGIYITKNILEIIVLIFYLFGSIVYLEFIELNCCNLNYYLKRKIKERAKTDTLISLTTIDNEYNDNEEENENN